MDLSGSDGAAVAWKVLDDVRVVALGPFGKRLAGVVRERLARGLDPEPTFDFALVLEARFPPLWFAFAFAREVNPRQKRAALSLASQIALHLAPALAARIPDRTQPGGD